MFCQVNNWMFKYKFWLVKKFFFEVTIVDTGINPQGLSFAGDHSFSTFSKFSEKLTFLTPDTHIYMHVSGGKKC